MGQIANSMANGGVAIPLPMARTDGRTNGRPTHLIESSSVPERAGEMRILTVRQPWAWAIIHGGKDVENRLRNVAGAYRGPVAIHAALTGGNYDSGHADLWPFGSRHVVGAIIGVVDLVGVHNGDGDAVKCFEMGGEKGWCSPWAEVGAIWHLELANPRPLAEPIPYKGALGLRRLPDDVADAVRKAAS